jgi:hypothetical protein
VDQPGDRLLVVRGQVVQVQPPGQDFVGKAPRIARLLPRQAGASKLLVARSGDAGWIRSAADEAVELGPDRGRRLDADLLADDRPEKGGIAGSLIRGSG